MGLSRKLLLSVALVYASLTGVICCVLSQQIRSQFADVESQEIEKKVHQVFAAFRNSEERLAAKTADWAQWDSTYEFMQSHDEGYFDSLINYSSLTNLEFSHLLYLNLDGQLVRGFQVHPQEKRVEGLSEEARKEILAQKFLYAELAASSRSTGVLKIGDRVFLVAAVPIRDSKREKISRGVMIATTDVTLAFVRRMAQQANVAAQAFRLGIDRLGQEDIRAAAGISKSRMVLIHMFDEASAYGYGIVKDLRGKPVILVRIASDRSIYQEGNESYLLLIVCLIINGLLTASAAALAHRRWVLLRCEEIYESLRRIDKNSNTSIRSALSSYERSLVIRILLVNSFLLIVSACVFFWTYSTVLISSFEEIERRIALSHLEKTRLAIDTRLSDLEAKAVDWGQWDDTYDYVLHFDQSYVDFNLNFETLAVLGVRYAVYFDQKGVVLTGVRADYDREVTSRLSEEERSFWSTNFERIRATDENGKKSGLLPGKNETLLFASSKIVDTDRSQSSRGTFVFAVAADARLTSALSQQTRLDLSFFPVQASARNSRTIGDSVLFPFDGNKLVASTLLPDTSGLPIVDLRVATPQTFSQQARQSLQMIAGILFAIAIPVFCAIVLALRSLVAGHLRRLGKDITSNLRVGNPTQAVIHAVQGQQKRLPSADDLQDSNAKIGKQNASAEEKGIKSKNEAEAPLGSLVGMIRLDQRKEKSAEVEVTGHSSDNSKNASIIEPIQLQTKRFNLRSRVRSALRKATAEAVKKPHLEITCSYDFEVPDFILSDPDRIEQMLSELLENSVKYTETGYVKLSVAAQELDSDSSFFLFSVKDSGIGIDRTILPTIFEEPIAPTKTKLTGLPFVKRLVDALGGEIRASNHPSGGSEIVVRVSLQRSQGNQDRNFEEIAGKKVWLLDNSRYLIQSLVSALRTCEVDVFCLDSNTLKELDLEKIDFSGADYLIVTKSALLDQEVWSFLESFTISKGTENVISLIDPLDTQLLDRLQGLGCGKHLTLPILADDIGRYLVGTYTEEDLQEEQPLKILVADDTPAHLTIMKNLIEEVGHSVVTVTNGEELLDRIGYQIGTRMFSPDDIDFDAIFTDIEMPRLGGLTAIRKIREQERQRGCATQDEFPIFAVTTRTQASEQADILEAGATGVIPKPVDRLKVLSLLRELGKGTSDVPTFNDKNALTAETLASIVTEAERLCLGGSILAPQIDIHSVLSRSGDSPRRCVVIFKSFLSGYTSLLEKLEESSHPLSKEELFQSAHALRGLLLETGAVSASQLAEELEGLARDGDLETAALRCHDLCAQVSQIAEILKKVVSSETTAQVKF